MDTSMMSINDKIKHLNAELQSNRQKVWMDTYFWFNNETENGHTVALEAAVAALAAFDEAFKGGE